MLDSDFAVVTSLNRRQHPLQATSHGESALVAFPADSDDVTVCMAKPPAVFTLRLVWFDDYHFLRVASQIIAPMPSTPTPIITGEIVDGCLRFAAAAAAACARKFA